MCIYIYIRYVITSHANNDVTETQINFICLASIKTALNFRRDCSHLSPTSRNSLC
jgi:hypothetical protein